MKDTDQSSKSSAEKVSEKECSCPENICVHTLDNGKNHKYDARNYLESQRFAISGLRLIIQNERNFRIQLVVALGVIAAGLLFQISHRDWVALFVVIAVVLVAEAFNSVVEAICDTIAKDYRLNVKYAKDVSAGAVLVSAIVSLIAGVIIFSPYVWELAMDVFSFLELF